MSKSNRPEPSKSPPYSWEAEYPKVVMVLMNSSHEDIGLYTKGGFHPTALGDTFSDGRFTIRHKLGHGGFSTVWLAHDSFQDRWVSIKIKQAYVSTLDLEQDTEVKTLKMLEQHYAKVSTDTIRWFPQLVDYFHHVGPNGTHTCIVSELLGPSVSKVLSSYRPIDPDEPEEVLRPDTVLRASRQILEAVKLSHEAGIVHGDIYPSNLLFTCNQAFGNEEDFWETLGGEPTTVDYAGKEDRPPNLPKHLVRSASWINWFDDPNENVCLVDWAESFPVTENRVAASLPQPFNLRSPETYFIESVDYRHDLWRAGCLIYQLFYQKTPFGFPMSSAHHVRNISRVVGPLPPTWHKKWEEMREEEIRRDKKQFGMDPSDDNPSRLLEDTFEPRREAIISYMRQDDDYENSEFSDADYEGLKCLVGVIRGLIHHEPGNRISAENALKCIDWIDHWREEKAENSEPEDHSSHSDKATSP